ncbi:MAG: nucleotide sugar dehydrogenase [Candidatus Elarobacter sp.]
MVVVGLGRAGLPFAVDNAKAGFSVIGIDRDPVRVAQLNQGSNYLAHVDDRDVIDVVESGSLRATGSFDALVGGDIVTICVTTPLGPAQTPDFGALRAIAAEVASRMRPGQLIILESGTYPGITREVLLPALAGSTLRLGEEYFVALSPERVDPGNPSFGAANTARIVSGATRGCIELACEFYRATVGAVVPIEDIAVAELTKVFENAFRAVNVALVNQLAILCDRMGVDVWDVVDAAATKPFGMMRFEPGPGVGGSGVPYDVQYLAWQARRHHAPSHLLEAAAEINASMPYFVCERIARALNARARSLNGARILLIGIAYKRNVPDAFESPAAALAEALERAGALVSYHDPLVPSVRWWDGSRRSSVPLDATALCAADCAAIITDHLGIDWELVVGRAPLVIDTRNATRTVRGSRANVVLL